MIRLRIALQRHAEYFSSLLAQANKLSNEGKLTDCLPELDAEWTNITLAFNFLKSRLKQERQLAILCNNYVGDAGFYLRLRRHPKEYLSWLQTAIEAAQILDSPKVETNHLGNIGNCYYLMGNFEQALTTYENCLQRYEQVGDLLGIARTFTGIGTIHAAKEMYVEALQCFEKSLEMAESAGDSSLAANALLNLGGIHNDKNNPLTALPLLQRAVELFTANNDLMGRIQATNNISTAYIILGDLNKAVRQLVIALQDANKLGAKREIANLLGNLGIIFSELQRLDEAIMLLRESLNISMQIGENTLADITRYNLSILLKKQKGLLDKSDFMNNKRG